MTRIKVKRLYEDGCELDWYSKGCALAGGYSRPRPLTFERGNVVVWLDLPFETVLRQVVGRSFKRAALKTSQLNGNAESFGRWLDKGHPIRIVLENYYRKSANSKLS